MSPRLLYLMLPNPGQGAVAKSQRKLEETVTLKFKESVVGKSVTFNAYAAGNKLSPIPMRGTVVRVERDGSVVILKDLELAAIVSAQSPATQVDALHVVGLPAEYFEEVV
jgi:hypothetical protein